MSAPRSQRPGEGPPPPTTRGPSAPVTIREIAGLVSEPNPFDAAVRRVTDRLLAQQAVEGRRIANAMATLQARALGCVAFVREVPKQATIEVFVWSDHVEDVEVLEESFRRRLPVTCNVVGRLLGSGEAQLHPVLQHCTAHTDCREHPALGRACWEESAP